MSLEHVNPAIVAAILIIPFICCVLPLILWSFKYWREKRKEPKQGPIETLYREEYHNNALLMTCNDCGTTENVDETGFCDVCSGELDEILESMNDKEEGE